jgi:hypothetical protein
VTDSLHLTPRDRIILQSLAQKVRLFSQRQIADHWWNGELPNSRRRLKRLAERGLVERITVLARAIPVLESPLVSWSPGDAVPDFGSIAYRCQVRWRLRPARPSGVAAVTSTVRTADPTSLIPFNNVAIVKGLREEETVRTAEPTRLLLFS